MSSVFLLTFLPAAYPRSPPKPLVHLPVEDSTSQGWGMGSRLLKPREWFFLLLLFFIYLFNFACLDQGAELVGLKEDCEHLCVCHQVDGAVPELGRDAGWLREAIHTAFSLG